MSPQLKHDEEHGITAQRCIEFVLAEKFGGPPEIIVQVSEVIELTLKKMGFKIVPMERADYEESVRHLNGVLHDAMPQSDGKGRG